MSWSTISLAVTLLLVSLWHTAHSLEIEMFVHQTWEDNNLSREQLNWRRTWQAAGFNSTLTTALGRYKDVQRFCEKMGSYKYMDAFSLLKIPAAKSDYWRIIKLYLDGGIYADLDAYASPALYKFLAYGPPHQNNVRMVVLMETEGTISERFSSYVYNPQYGNMFLAAEKEYTGLIEIVNMMTDNIFTNRWSGYVEPYATLLTTGPPCLTMALQKLDPSAVMVVKIDCWAKMQLVDQEGAGSWRVGTFLPTLLSTWIRGFLVLCLVAAFCLVRVTRKVTRRHMHLFGILILIYTFLTVIHQYGFLFKKILFGLPSAFVPLERNLIRSCPELGLP
eukprot:Colp12_sorted_trinity150504_noHs@261